MSELDPAYWDGRYRDQNIPWDLGKPSRPLVEFAESLPRKDCRILIPGAGSAHEAAWLWENGFEQVAVLDWSTEAVRRFQDTYPDFPATQLIVGDFFAHEGEYDLVLEQTFFCALPPERRGDYARKMHSLIGEGGHLAGVWFNFPLKPEKGPPFGGSAEEYRAHFAPYFEIEIMEPCRNSEPDRMGKELFLKLRRNTER